MKIVFDTNIYISAFVIPGGNAEKAYLHAIDGNFELCTSIAILTELARKLEEKFDWEKQKIVQLINSISDLATVLKITPWLKSMGAKHTSAAAFSYNHDGVLSIVISEDGPITIFEKGKAIYSEWPWSTSPVLVDEKPE